MTGDTYRTVMNSYESKKINIEKLKSQVDRMEKDTESRLAEIDKNNAELNVSVTVCMCFVILNCTRQSRTFFLISMKNSWKILYLLAQIKKKGDNIF